jgi:transcriptional regulator of arginine metabolism
MPSDLEIRERRREAILEIVMGKDPVRTQAQMVQRLKEKGIAATQSSISRDLHDLGITRVKGRYVLEKVENVLEVDFRRVVGFIHSVKAAGPFTVVVVTHPGAARVVGLAIDQAMWPEVVGTVSGEDTIFIATESAHEQRQLFRRLGGFLEE